ncbi:MAG: chromosome segregation protein SMC [Candidatus Riflebacteria bacterium HGW-Riflebacteria-1]|jgi:exonuclease SbcC|nr:MAG: chromosome segregation protein SMC [Candidatus Riflebacteria bacterium HGW-Riflebacteria-1]
MKILELRFKNLNSLQGEWKIDFMAPEYIADGIFAMTGPTGSGKSTILDAICLALYGRTPRLKNISQSSNEIMSRQTGECFAEVLFECQSGRFRCHWSQHRARRNPDGNLAAAAHEISEASSGKVLETRRLQVLDLVEMMTGMDFNRFTRSVMLAQGDFAAFLQSNARDRAPILEQITGTDIYSQISIKVFERHNEENSRLEQLNAAVSGIMFMSEEEESLTGEILAQKQNSSQELSKSNAENTAAIQWLTGIDSLRTEIARLLAESVTIDQQIEAFSTTRSALKRADQAAELDGDFAALTTTRQQQASDRNQLQTCEQGLPELEKALNVTADQLRASEQATAGSKAARQSEAPFLLQARALDLRAAELQKSVTESENELKKSEKQLTTNRESLAAAENDSRGAQAELEAVKVWLNTNAGDEKLVSEFSAISAQIGNLAEFFKDRAAAESAVEDGEKQQKKLVKACQTSEKELQTANKEYEAAQQETGKITEALQKLLEGLPISEYHARREALLEKKYLLEKIASLEEERKTLQDGHPCPLCGATEHPYAAGNVPAIKESDKEIKRLAKLIKTAETLEIQLKELRDNEAAIMQKRSEAEGKLTIAAHENATHEKAFGQLAKELEKTVKKAEEAKTSVLKNLGEYGITELPEGDAEEILSTLRSRLVKWQQQQKSSNEIETRLHKQNAELQNFAGIIKTLEESVAAKKAELIARQKNHQLLLTERQQLYGDKNPDVEEARLDKQLSLAEQTEKQAREKHEQAGKALNHLKSQIKTLADSIDKRMEQLAALENGFALNLARKGFADEKDFAACRMSADQRNQLKNRADELDRKRTEIIARKSDRERVLTDELAKNTTESGLDTLKQTQIELETALKSLGEEIGALRQKLLDNTRAKELIKSKKAAIDAQRTECHKWKVLNDLIGSSDGNKFRKFAQGITFEMLVELANNQLHDMTDRYILLHDRENPLELQVIDTWQSSRIRSTQNLSGGESFIVSLALALGLSKMASKKVRIDSLFLDEGFGTLDEDALETALETLAGLQQTGKLIGIISHVPSLKERISTQITVKPVAAGRSRIEGPGVTAA